MIIVQLKAVKKKKQWTLQELSRQEKPRKAVKGWHYIRSFLNFEVTAFDDKQVDVAKNNILRELERDHFA